MPASKWNGFGFGQAIHTMPTAGHGGCALLVVDALSLWHNSVIIIHHLNSCVVIFIIIHHLVLHLIHHHHHQVIVLSVVDALSGLLGVIEFFFVDSAAADKYCGHIMPLAYSLNTLAALWSTAVACHVALCVISRGGAAATAAAARASEASGGGGGGGAVEAAAATATGGESEGARRLRLARVSYHALIWPIGLAHWGWLRVGRLVVSRRVATLRIIASLNHVE